MRENCRRFGIVGCIAVTFVVLAAGPAFGHAALLSTSPADGTVYPTGSPPSSVTLRFGENVGIKLGAVRLYDEHGGLVNTGPPTHPDDDKNVSVSLPKLDAGTYVVTWRVISADTHPVSGAFTFSVGTEQKNVSALTEKLLSSADGSRTVGVLYGVERFLLFGALIALLGGGAFVVLVWPAGRQSKPTGRILWIAWWTSLGVTVVGFAIEGIYAAAFPLRDLLEPTVLSDTLHGRYGETAVARVVLLLLAAPLLRTLVASRADSAESVRPLWRWWVPTATILAIALILTVTLAGHATTGRWSALAGVADVLHVGAGSLWFGGLLMLVGVALPGADAESLARVLPGFSKLAFGAVVAIVLSGLFQAVRQVGTIHALFHTTYGLILVAKVVAFGVLVLFGACSRAIVNCWYAPSPDQPSSSVNQRVEVRQLRKAVGIEVAVATVVLVLTAFLVDARPAYEITNGPQVLKLASSPSPSSAVVFDLVVQPAKAGPNQIHVSTETPSGLTAHPLQVTIELTNPSHDVGPLRARLVRISPGHFLAYSFNLPFTGTWQVTVRALMTQFDEAVATGNVSIR